MTEARFRQSTMFAGCLGERVPCVVCPNCGAHLDPDELLWPEPEKGADSRPGLMCPRCAFVEAWDCED